MRVELGLELFGQFGLERFLILFLAMARPVFCRLFFLFGTLYSFGGLSEFYDIVGHINAA